jgi:hypothetical protein
MSATAEQLPKEEVEQLIQQLRNVITIDDIVAGILVNSEKNNFTANPRAIHSIFNKLVSESNIDLLNELQFSKGDGFPYSHLLERVLFRLEWCGLIRLQNPTYDSYRIDGDVKQKIAERLKGRFSTKLFGQVANLSKSFTTLANDSVV